MKVPFTKMHGIGNDYIYINCFREKIDDPSALSVAMSPRHFSVGSDGLVLICPSETADAKMRMFNADGSEGNMCGNAIRCVGKYLYEHGICHKTDLTIETKSGIKNLTLFPDTEDEITAVKVYMGKAETTPGKIPVLSDHPMIAEPVAVNGKIYHLTAVSMGNPHAVCFDLAPAGLDLEKMGPFFEHHPLFPDRVNTEFARVIEPHTIEMRVWERGSGETFACGTGACATVAAAVICGLSPAEEPITVRLRGGELTVTYSRNGDVFMTGVATEVYEGVYRI